MRGVIPEFLTRIERPYDALTELEITSSMHTRKTRMYELADGSKGVVQPLGNFLGDWNAPPYVKLTGDDRFGSPGRVALWTKADSVTHFERLEIKPLQ